MSLQYSFIKYHVSDTCPACSSSEYNEDGSKKVIGTLLIDEGKNKVSVLQCSKCKFRTRLSGKRGARIRAPKNIIQFTTLKSL